MMDANGKMPGLPAGWDVTRLENVTTRISNGANATQYKEPIGLPISRIETISDGHIDLSRVRYVKEKSSDFIERYRLQNGDILFSHINSDAHLGKTALYRDKYGPLIHGINLLLIRPSRHLNSTFLNYQFQYMRSMGMFIAVAQRAVNQSSINQRRLNAFGILVPPSSEQDRIVAKIEELFSELDNGIESLTTARQQLAAYRQSVLKYVFEGKLTEGWRKNNPKSTFSKQSLVAHVRRQRRNFYEEKLKFPNGNGKKKSSPVLENITPLEGEEIEHLPSLTGDWQWFRLGDLAGESVLGKMLDKEKNRGDLKPYLANINVRWGRFDLENLSEMRFERDEAERYGLQQGDLVICEGGEPGRCAIWREPHSDMRIQKALHRVRVPQKLLLPEYLYYTIILANELGYIRKHFTGTTIKHLTGEGLSNVEIPLCSIEEQRIIVGGIETNFSEIQALEAGIDTELQKAEALRQSILKKSFSGQLVVQDARDESASALLARIRAERERLEPKKKRNSKNGKKNPA